MGSGQCWSVETAIAASKDPSANGRRPATPGTHGAAPAGRCARMTADGSTAVTCRSGGSYAPVPAPTLTTVRASPSAAQIRAASRGSVGRVAAYVAPIVSNSWSLDIVLALSSSPSRLSACCTGPALVDDKYYRVS